MINYSLDSQDCGFSGVTWERDSSAVGTCAPTSIGYKASIANSLLMVVSAKLYELTHQQQYLTMAETIWYWLSNTVLDGKTGLIRDGFEQFGCKVHPDFWSYNQGVPLAALSNLYLTTKNKTYLTAAEKLAAASMAHFTDSNGIVRETICEGNGSCGCDGAEFRGPFVRGLSALYQVNRDAKIRELLNSTLTSALEKDCNSNWQFQLHWGGPYNLHSTAATQIPVLDLFAAAYTACFT